MRRMLEELYFGNINPNEKQFVRNSNFARALKTISANEEKLTEFLEGKEKDLFLQLVNAQSEIDGIVNVESFISGFRLGARIAIEIMNEDDGCLVDIT